MQKPTQLTIVARSEEDFDKLLSRGQALVGTVVRLQRGDMFYEAPIVRELYGNPATYVVEIEFDTVALQALGVALDGRLALDAAEQATKH
jgi:hypothetical protein